MPTQVGVALPSFPTARAQRAASFFEELTFTSATTLSMRVWGDDTVQVFLNGVAQNLPRFHAGYLRRWLDRL